MSASNQSVDNDGPLSVSRFDYDLPPELIAQQPIEPRDAARLLVVDRNGDALDDRAFTDLPSYLRDGDLIVVNDTRVLPARLAARRSTGGSLEILLLSRVEQERWLGLIRPGRRVRDGETLAILGRDGEETIDTATIIERQSDQFVVQVSDEVIVRNGKVPLPPYIRQAIDNPERYQTVYARDEGSAAAPTAGLHFTDEVVKRCEQVGATFEKITLHVGLDTFQPIKVDDAREHQMHSEWFRIPNPALIRAARQDGRRIIAIGTTSVRTLEAAAERVLDPNQVDAVEGWTDVFITPGHQFRLVDGMVTNFHLPRTTLMLLVSAFAGEERIRRAYEHAIRQRYRFLSFGDAMLIV